MTRSRAILALLLVLVPALLWGGARAWQAAQASLAAPHDRHAGAYAGSGACRSCHQDHHASWHRTFHRTMTQEASARSVQGAFDGRLVEAWGGRMRPVRRGDQFFFEMLDAEGGVKASYEVQRTVGSHRYQQYLAHQPDNGQYRRLPLLWHNGDARWVHVNSAFLYDDQQSYTQHVTTWNHNCIYCHNTGPQPRIRNSSELYARAARGQPVNFLAEARYDSEVAELGIACEACHGPGAEHAARNRNPLRRYLLSLGGTDDPTIVNPRKLDARRATHVCAQCHGQRVPVRDDLVETWLSSGPTFRPGDDLAQHVRWIHAAFPAPAGNPDLYRLRFWADGTPRLSAYEFQGLSQSPCYQEAALSCQTCHDAHGGDVHGMMREGARAGAPCLECHQKIAADVPAHTRHAAGSSGSQCTSCHMPPMVYGVMEIHRSHRIEVPRVARDHELERPNACAGCHLNRSAAWLARPSPETAAQLAENTRQLLGGDPVQRAVAARLAGRADSALTPAERAALIPVLLLAMEDGYPAVRRFAWHSLRDIAAATGFDTGGQDFDFTGARAQRAVAIDELRRRWARDPRQAAPTAGVPAPAELAALRAQAAATASINIGE